MSIFNLLPLKTAVYWLRVWCHLPASYFEGGAFWWFITIFSFSCDNSFCILISYFQQIIRHVIYMSETIVSIAIMQYKQSFYPISDLSEQTCKLGFFFLIILCFLLFFVTVAFFTAEKKGGGGGRDVSNNKLFQILGRVYTSLHNRRFMSQARRTPHFVRSVRRGEEKNKAAVASPLFWLLLCRLCLY